MLVAILALSVPLGVYAWRAATKRAERTAAEQISRLGGACLTDELGECVAEEPFRAPSLVDQLLLDCRSAPYIDDVCLQGCRAVKDDDLKILRGFRRLHVLDLSGTSVTDNCVPEIAAIHSLLRLDVSGTRITKSGAERLRSSLPNCIVIHEEPDND